MFYYIFINPRSKITDQITITFYKIGLSGRFLYLNNIDKIDDS